MKKQSFIFGINSIQHALENYPNRVLSIYIAKNKQNKRLASLQSLAEQAGIGMQIIDNKKLDQWCDGGNHQGVAAEIQAQALLGESDLKQLIQSTQEPLFLILDGVQDPYNFGACLRTAEAVGVTAVIIPKDRSVSVTPTVSKVACGAAESVSIVAVSNLARAMKTLQEEGVWIVGTAASGDQSLYEVDCRMPLALVLGGEGSGIRKLTEKHCDYLVSIPMVGQVESLNISVATGVCVYEVLRQRNHR